MDAVPASYLEAHRYDGAAVEHGRRDRLEYCALQPRDLAIVRDVWRYKFLTAPQLRELWWPGGIVQAADRRLLKLFRAGHLDRFRPYARRGTGSYPWTYHLGEEGASPPSATPATSPIASATSGDRSSTTAASCMTFNSMRGCSRTAAPSATASSAGTAKRRSTRHRGCTASRGGSTTTGQPKGLHHDRPRSVCPDAILEIAGTDPTTTSRLIFVEYDRTRRLDKNYDKFQRYDAFLTWWWRHTPLGKRETPPFILFVCQDEEQRDLFIDAADRHLTGHRWHPDVAPDRYEYVGRQRVLFAAELDAHAGVLEARRIPAAPKGHVTRSERVRRVRIATSAPASSSASPVTT